MMACGGRGDEWRAVAGFIGVTSGGSWDEWSSSAVVSGSSGRQDL
jgi:hypothetical protein